MVFNPLSYRNVKGTIIGPVNVIHQNDVKLSRFIRWLVEWHFPESSSIFDPTPGDKNHMFSEYLERSGDCEWTYAGRYRYVAYSIEPVEWSRCGDGYNRIDVLEEWPLESGSFDVVFYDPPYLPRARQDKRGRDYGIEESRGLDDIKRYYSREVLSEALRVARHGIVIKGADFYYPSLSYNFYSFAGDIVSLEFLRGAGSVAAMYIYQFFHGNMILYRARIAKRWRRPVNANSYYLVVYKGDYMPPAPHDTRG